MKLPESKRSRIKIKEKYKIRKDGKVSRDGKTLSKAYERRYSHKIVQTYMLDRQDRVRNKKGQWISNKQADKYKELMTRSKERTDRKTKQKKLSVSRRQTKGRFMQANYAHTFECTCYIEEGITTHEEDKVGRTITHYYTISTSEQISLGTAEIKHNQHYPAHTLININHSSTKVLSFD